MKHENVRPLEAPGDIMVVDDNLENLRAIETLLKEQGYKVRCTPDAKTALEVAANKPPEIMLLDVIMPDMNGYEVCRALKARPETAEFPIIFLTALTEMENLVEGFQAGGVDFLSKPVRPEELLAHVNTHLELYRARKAIQQHAELLEQRVAERTAELQETNRQLRENITERKLVENQLRIAKVYAENLIETANAMVVGMDSHGRVTVFNHTAEKITGYTQSEMLNRNWFEVIVPKDRYPEVWDEFERLLAGGLSKNFENPILTKEGEERYIVWQNNDVRENGNIVGTISFGIDITERKHAEKKLRESEERFRNMMEQAPFAIEILTPDGRINQVNPAWRRIWGIPEELLPQVLEKYNMLKDEQARELRIMPLIEKVFAGEPVILPPIEYDVVSTINDLEITNAHGRKRWIQSQLYPLKSVNGEVLNVVNMYEDITERKKAEEALRKDEKILEQIFATTNSMIAYMDRDFNFIRVNRAYADAGGREPEDFIGENHFVLYPHEENEAIFRHVVETGEPYVVAAKPFEHPDQPERGTTYWDWALLPVKEEQGDVTGLLLSLSDVTEQKQAELVLQQANVELEHKVDERTRELIEANKLLQHAKVAAEEAQLRAEDAQRASEAANRAKSEFLANMSHEIRTPMNAILGFAEILTRKETDPKKSQYVNNIHAGGKALLNLINDILDLSKIEAGKLDLHYSAISVASLVEELHVIFEQKIAEKGLDFLIDLDEQLPRALVLDETRLRQVLLNLLGNAVKFTDAGHIHLRVTSTWCDTEIHSRVNLVFEVEDTGIGIPPAAQEKIFDPFEQTKGQKVTAFGGTGLGLTITRRMGEMMGGEISVESESGSGTTFRVRLPGVEVAAVEALQTDREAGLNIETIRFEPATILIADDLDYNREMLAAYLEDWPFTIYEAANGQEVLDLAHRYAPDVILLDMKMPVMDGYQAAERIKQDERIREIPVIAVTASALKQDEARISQLCDGYLRKPVSQHDVTEQLIRFLPYTQQAEPSGISQAVPEPVHQKLTPDALLALPPEWLEAFSHAVKGADSDACLSLITALAPEFNSVAQALQNMVNNYQFAQLMTLFPS